jgi:hypothetical protein
MMNNKTFAAALLCSTVMIAAPAFAQVSGVVGAAGDSAASGQTTIKPQAGTPPIAPPDITPSADAAAQQANDAAKSAPNESAKVDGANDPVANAQNNVPSSSIPGASASSNANAAANASSQASANASDNSAVQAALGSDITLGQPTKAKTASAERAATKKLNNAQAQAGGIIQASATPSSLNASSSASGSASTPSNSTPSSSSAPSDSSTPSTPPPAVVP